MSRWHLLSAFGILWAGYCAFDGAMDGCVLLLAVVALANLIYVVDELTESE